MTAAKIPTFFSQLDQQVEPYTAQIFTLYTDATAFFVHISTECQLQGPFAGPELLGGRFEPALRAYYDKFN